MSISIIDANSYHVLRRFERTQRLAVCTHGAESDLPGDLVAAADVVCAQAEIDFRFPQLPAGADQVIVWEREDQWLEGSVQQARAHLLTPATVFLVPVHWKATSDLDLIGLQPQLISAGSPRTYTLLQQSRLRSEISAATDAATPRIHALRAADLPPTRISAAICQDCLQPGSGLDDLLREASLTTNLPVFRALSLRNAIVIHARDGRMAEAQRLLKIGLDLFPDYAELPYLEALFHIYAGNSSQAVPHLIRATSLPTGSYLGSGGENSYRAHWLLAELAGPIGKQGIAVHHAMTGVRRRPTFEPSLAVLLKQRISTQTLSVVQWELTGLARREPQYFKPIFDYFLLHRLFTAAERMLRTSVLSEEERGNFEERLALITRAPRRQPGSNRPHCLLQGAFFVHSSAALINRKLGAALVQSSSLFGALDPFGYGLEPPASFAEYPALHEGLYRIPTRLDCTVRNHWPHDFERPDHGQLATIIPWEFTGVPKAWVKEIRKHVDEVWVPSRFTRSAFVEGGVPAERIRVIPNGIDPATFCPEGPRFRPQGARSFVFLFVGGLIQRKGADLLVRAYRRAFRSGDDVSLVLKDVGSSNFYRHITLLPEIEKLAAQENEPHLLLIKEDLTEAGLAALYRGSNAFVLPYRGEGFGFPVAEAMACGVPVITTGAGPAPEFCPEGATCLVPARSIPVPRQLLPAQELTAPLHWFEPDEEALAQAMREMVEQYATWQERARHASSRIRATHAWDAVTAQYLERILALTGSEPNRMTR